MKYSSNKELNILIVKLIKEGWRYERRKKHGMLKAPQPSDTIIHVSTSPSDYRTVLNVKALAKNAV